VPESKKKKSELGFANADFLRVSTWQAQL